ncbi:MAG: energy transducer TonB [Pyrinomonadaceae bacterium]|nr:energy transducer TonB [Pyrinomonadaceae bacterium]
MKFSLRLITFIFLLSVISIFAQTETEKGIDLYRNGDFDGAISLLEKAVKINEKDRKAWIYLGASLVKKGNQEEALKDFQKADSIRGIKDDVKSEIISDGLKITLKSFPLYTDLARQNKVSGTTKLAIEFGSDGKIGMVFAIQSLPDGLTENTILAASKIKFDPAQKDNKPITVVRIIEYSFSTF